MARRTPAPASPASSESSASDAAAALREQVQAAVAAMDPAAAQQVVARLLQLGSLDPYQSLLTPPRPHLRRTPRADVVTYRVRIDLDHARPPIWRRLDLRSDLTLDVMHQVIQTSFGWWDYHLHRFALGGSVWDRGSELFLCPYDVEEQEDEGTPASAVRLDETLVDPGDKLRYCYDYGDSWELTIKLEAVLERDTGTPMAVCVDGRRAAPPEDCGGLTDAHDLATVVEDPAHLDVEEINQALHDPFLGLRDSGLRDDLVDLVTRLRGAAYGDDLVARASAAAWGPAPEVTAGQRAAALQPFLWFLDRVGTDGLPLTAAGYVKPIDVKAAVGVLPRCADWIHSVRTEVDCFPVLQFRESLQALGLVRKLKGRLVLTKAGAAVRHDPERLWRHLVARLPTGAEQRMGRSAGLLVMLMAASAADIDYGLVAQAMTDLGWRMDDRQAVTPVAVRRSVDDLTGLLANLVTGPRRSFWDEAPLSPVATALAREALLSGR